MHLDRLAVALEADVRGDLGRVERRPRRLERVSGDNQRQLASRARKADDHPAAHAGERQRAPPDVGQVHAHHALGQRERFEVEEPDHPDDAAVVRRVVVDAGPAAARATEAHDVRHDQQVAVFDDVEPHPRPRRDVREHRGRARGERHRHRRHQPRDVLVVDRDPVRGRVDADDVALPVVGGTAAAERDGHGSRR